MNKRESHGSKPVIETETDQRSPASAKGYDNDKRGQHYKSNKQKSPKKEKHR